LNYSWGFGRKGSRYYFMPSPSFERVQPIYMLGGEREDKTNGAHFLHTWKALNIVIDFEGFHNIENKKILRK
jgi:hypothetical protein